MDGEPDQYIDFMVKLKDWVAIKRASFSGESKPQDISFALAGVRGSIDRKVYTILGIKTEIMDACADNLTKGQRKSYEVLASVITSLGKPDAKKAVEESCAGKTELKPLAETYLLNKVITNLGYDTFLNQTAMSKIWKELKPPKPRGRVAGSKKKESTE